MPSWNYVGFDWQEDVVFAESIFFKVFFSLQEHWSSGTQSGFVLAALHFP